MKKLTIDVAGMHCKSCELLLEKSLQKVENVEKVHADQAKGTVEISYAQNMPDGKTIESIIEKSGYTIGKEMKLPWFHADPCKYMETAFIVLILLVSYFGLNMGGFSFGNFGNLSSPTLGVAFLVGLTAGVSGCMALVGGLVLGISAKWNQEHIQASKWHRFEPHLFFNIGRIAGFGVLGGLLGLFGSFASLSPLVIGGLMVATGCIMLILGANLAELSPRLSRVSITLPKFLGADIMNGWKTIPQSPHPSPLPEGEGVNLPSPFKGEGSGVRRENGIIPSFISKHTWAISTGVLTFFLPCGFTLAMQAYAITTGSFTTGALTMMAFALGTAPGLLGVGGLTSYLSGASAKRFFKFTGVLVLLLAVFNISNGYNLISLGNPAKATTVSTVTISEEVQEIRMTEGDGGYSPREFHIKPNTKTRWIVTATNPYSCASQLVAPAIDVSKQLEMGENIIEFISPADGTIKFSCSMGMYTGRIVVDSTGPETKTSTPPNPVAVSNVSTGNAYSCSMGSGTKR